VFIAGGALMLAACSETPTTPSPPSTAPSARPSFDLACRSGYVIAFDENGDPYCAPDPNIARIAAQPESRP
jgi:hypothetical protein